MSRSDLIEVAIQLKHETEKAYLVSDGVKEFWIPKSQCELTQDGNAHLLSLPEWLAKDKGFI